MGAAGADAECSAVRGAADANAGCSAGCCVDAAGADAECSAVRGTAGGCNAAGTACNAGSSILTKSVCARVPAPDCCTSTAAAFDGRASWLSVVRTRRWLWMIWGIVSSSSQSKASTASLIMISSLVRVGDRRARSSVSAAISWLLPSLTTESSNSLIRVMIPEVGDEGRGFQNSSDLVRVCRDLPEAASASALFRDRRVGDGGRCVRIH